MEGFEPKFHLPSNWVDDSQTKCYTNLDTGDVFCYSEELFCFIDPLPKPTPLEDGLTNMEMGNKSSSTEEPFEETPAMEPAPQRGPTNMEMGNKSCSTEEPFEETPAMEPAPQRGRTNKSSSTEEPSDFADKVTPAMEPALERKELPLRLYYGNGPRIHKQLCIEYGVVNKRCEDCGEVGNLTCFSSSFRKWALRRVTEEEMNQTCSRCYQRGHNCLNCDIPITYRMAPDQKKKKTVHCGLCGGAGHNRRSCFKAD